MTTYDDKTKGIFASGGRFVLPLCNENDDVTFRASYIVVPGIKCKGKITALFDLIVLGDIEANEIDVKGRFVCLGKCTVSGSIVVQNEIWVNDLRALRCIESHDKIVAQEIEANTIFAEGSIVVGRLLAVDKIAKSNKKILCGETAHGTGKVAANTIITGEPLDLDDGVNAVVSPNYYQPVTPQSQPTQSIIVSPELKDLIARGESEYAPSGDSIGYLDFLTSSVYDGESKAKFAHWKEVLSKTEAIKQNGISRYLDIAIIIWLADIVGSDYFKNWVSVNRSFNLIQNHFKSLIEKDRNAVGCVINTFENWLRALLILNRFRELVDRTVWGIAFELVVSNLGLKAKFVTERLDEKGWESYAE